MSNYTIQKDRTKRISERPSAIVLVHANDLIHTGYPISPKLRRSTDSYTWGLWQDYFLNQVSKNNSGWYSKFKLPMHYFIELVDTDYAVNMGLSEYKQSWFLERMANFGIIDGKYKNALLVVIGANMNFDFLPQRFYDQLTQKVLDPLMHRYMLTLDDIFYYDEILTDTYDKKMTNPDFKFEFEPMSKYNFLMLKLAVDRIHWTYPVSKRY